MDGWLVCWVGGWMDGWVGGWLPYVGVMDRWLVGLWFDV